MKEITLKVGNIWSLLTAIVITAMVCGSAIYISMQFNKTQWDISQNQANATKEAADKISNGLDELGKGVCRSGSTSVYSACGF